MSFVIGGNNPVSTGYNLTRSLRFRSSATAYLNRTLATPTNNKIWTLSTWIKRGALGVAYAPVFGGGSSGANYSLSWFTSSDTLIIFAYNGVTSYQLTTTQVFRDPSASYHIVLAVDTTQATASNRVKLYVNGAQVTAFSTATYPALNYNDNINSAVAHYFAQFTPALGANYYDGYIAETNFIDGQALTPSSFGSTNATTGVWQPARYTGTYGTNGFYLPFTDNSALTTSSNVGLGKDFSGNANYWVTNNISITAGVTYDSMTDVPTLTSATAANFCVWNAVKLQGNSASDGNLKATTAAGGPPYLAGYGVRSTIGTPTSGKWYAEITPLNTDSQDGIGITDINTWNTDVNTSGNNTVYYRASGTKYVNGTNNVAYGSSYVANDVIGVAVDIGAGTVTFYKNNVSQGAITLPSSAASYCFLVTNGNAAATSFAGNFGQRPFSYTPPTGFVALNTYNLPTSTIVKGNTVMDATLYTGTLLSNAITNAAAFKPDLVWVKSRSAATDHKWTDSVRGVTKALASSSTAAETTDTQGLTAFGSAGFTVGTNTDYNNLAATYVAWQWQAGQGSSSSNTNGSITSTVSVNASAGFSVATYTGAGGTSTIGHGLGVTPAFVIIKSRSDVTNWVVYHQYLNGGSSPQNYYLYLNSTNAQATISNIINPNSSTVSTTNYGATNQSGSTYVMYCWTPIAGFSAFGSYTGNGSTDGTFVYTGFRPKYILIKRTDSISSWCVHDSSRDPYNVVGASIQPDNSSAEASNTRLMDFVSNGFKNRENNADSNASGGTYIYAAFAENPFKNSLAR